MHLHVIIDASQSEYSHESLARRALSGGATIIQLRDKNLPSNELLRIAKIIRELTSQYSACFIVNDRGDVAMAVGADGVHLGQDDLPLAETRKLLGDSAIIGVSCGSVEEAQDAEREGASYIGFGHMYPTSSKQKLTPQRTLRELTLVANAVAIPVIAIGGITADRIAELLAAGATGVAAIGAICNAIDPEAATRNLMQALRTRAEIIL
ncbi:MAG TPA: thiamine phosphate synthase [Candidatus Kapabacteria bacterium]|nr:thiamine phosphate synthase [Candidatus Kapabacteria bacterium]